MHIPSPYTLTPPPGFAQLSAHPEKSASAGSGLSRPISLRLALDRCRRHHKQNSSTLCCHTGSKSATGNNSHNTAGPLALATATNASDAHTNLTSLHPIMPGSGSAAANAGALCACVLVGIYRHECICLRARDCHCSVSGARIDLPHAPAVGTARYPRGVLAM